MAGDSSGGSQQGELFSTLLARKDGDGWEEGEGGGGGEGFGMALSFEDGKVWVASVKEGSAADAANLISRDRIVSVDGKLVRHSLLCATRLLCADEIHLLCCIPTLRLRTDKTHLLISFLFCYCAHIRRI